MSCVVSCSTDSGVRNPAMLATFVAAGGGGVGGGGAGDTWSTVESAGVPGLWDAECLLAMGSQAAPTASRPHTTLGLMLPSPAPFPSSAPRSPCAPRPAAPPDTHETSTGTFPGRASANAAWSRNGPARLRGRAL